MNILFIRGGALGDLVLTLPTLRLLRERWPDAHIEILGHPHLAEIAVGRYYLSAARSVNHGPLTTFFMPRAVLDPAWMEYIGDFDLVLSYFYDPDGLFRHNLERCQPGEILTHPPRVPEGFARPAAHHFAGILEPLGLALGADAASEVFPTPDDIAGARAFLQGLDRAAQLIAVHPGSGSETKNWPREKWAQLGPRLAQAIPGAVFLLIEGESDAEAAEFVAAAWKELPHLRARLLPLPILAALLREARLFLGHDSGVTHLAAAARKDLPIVALFGPTDPVVWAPPRPGVRVLRGTPTTANLTVDEVAEAAVAAL
jgi:heptosyltransferase-2